MLRDLLPILVGAVIDPDPLDILAAQQLEATIRTEWVTLRSLLSEADRCVVWETLGYTRPGQWVTEVLGDDLVLPMLGNLGTIASGRPQAARVSRPGRNVDTDPRRAPVGRSTDVQPRFKESQNGSTRGSR